MADKELDDEVALAPEMPPLLERATVDWLEPMRARLDGLQAQGRMPHGLLLTGTPGAGQAEIAAWLGARLLCRADAGQPCGQCADCRLFRAGNHPDFRWLGVLPDKKDIGIEQLRALSEALSMRSYRGGVKVSVISPADAMSQKAHNALLKTLEEPASETYLVLTASRLERIPQNDPEPLHANCDAAARIGGGTCVAAPAWRFAPRCRAPGARGGCAIPGAGIPAVRAR